MNKYEKFILTKKIEPDEFEIQVMVVEWYKENYPNERIVSDLGGFRLTIGLAKKAKKIRPDKGYPDIFIPIPTSKTINFKNGEPNYVFYNYCGLFIELKTKEGILKPGQKKWLEYLNNKGYYAVSCYGYNECINTIENYFSGNL